MFVIFTLVASACSGDDEDTSQGTGTITTNPDGTPSDIGNDLIVTTGGVVAGIDGALHVVQRLAGKEVAEWTAESWMEHHLFGSTDAVTVSSDHVAFAASQGGLLHVLAAPDFERSGLIYLSLAEPGDIKL